MRVLCFAMVEAEAGGPKALTPPRSCVSVNIFHARHVQECWQQCTSVMWPQFIQCFAKRKIVAQAN